ncbi:MAG: DUF3306 domain-containing protein [Alphaproteobacteria bacterium]|nr:DUF3306 domain-containing protein [Alphaproteobacteria bacterium]
MNEKSDQHSFLERWSRRKRGVESEDDSVVARPTVSDENVAEETVGVGRATGEEEQGSVEPSEQVAEKDFADFDFDKLDYDSDYKQFMDKNVSSDARHKALRKLWVSNPVLANMDGLDDYCEDYTDAAVCLPKGTMKTAYQYGRGFLNDEEVAEWEALGHEPKDEETVDEQSPERADDKEAVVAEGDVDAGREDGGVTAAATHGATTEQPDTDSGPGAACGVAVKQDEAEMLAEFDAEKDEDRTDGKKA